jgi:hypothetical protein
LWSCFYRSGAEGDPRSLVHSLRLAGDEAAPLLIRCQSYRCRESGECTASGFGPNAGRRAARQDQSPRSSHRRRHRLVQQTFSQGSVGISSDLNNEAAEATKGCPFLIQLVGYYLWLEVDRAKWKLDQSSVRRGVAAALRRNTLAVIESAHSDISDKDRALLDVIAAQDGPSAVGRIGTSSRPSPKSCPSTETGSSPGA